MPGRAAAGLIRKLKQFVKITGKRTLTAGIIGEQEIKETVYGTG